MNAKPSPQQARASGARRLLIARSRAQRGAVSMMLGLSMMMLIAFAGIALDLGRLYVNKSELQTASDSCALAAAAELTCSTGTTGCIANALAAGKFAAGLNKRDFQANATTIADADVLFSTAFDSGYADSATANPNSRFAKCIARAAGIAPWFMKMVGIGDQTVNAQAVASVVPGRSTCPTAPIGVCAPAGGAAYAVGDWVVANATGNGNGGTALGNAVKNYGASVKGTFRWIDYDPNAGGTNEVDDRLAGLAMACGVTLGSTINEEGTKQGAKDAFNTRFGVYPNGANGYTATNAAPDRTGFSYPTTNKYVPQITVGTSAYADYRKHQTAFDAFQGTGKNSTYDPQGNGTQNINGNAITGAQHQTYGTNARLITVPIVSGCNGSTHAIAMQSMGCFLMLNPMANSASGDTFMEYRGNANAADSPCAAAGGAGGPGSPAGSVPTLVQ